MHIRSSEMRGAMVRQFDLYVGFTDRSMSELYQSDEARKGAQIHGVLATDDNQ